MQRSGEVRWGGEGRCLARSLAGFDMRPLCGRAHYVLYAGNSNSSSSSSRGGRMIMCSQLNRWLGNAGPA